MAVTSVLLVFLHDLIGPCEEDCGAEKGQMDKDLPLDVQHRDGKVFFASSFVTENKEDTMQDLLMHREVFG